MQRQEQMSVDGRHQIEERLGRQENLSIIYGEASFAADQTGDGSRLLHVRSQDGSTRQIASARVFLDVGQRPESSKLEGLDGTPYLDSSSILELRALPEHLLILGGGYIAVEFAQMFRRFGSRVTVVQRGPHLLDREDDDVATCLLRILEEDGIRVLLHASAKRVAHRDGSVLLTYESDGQEVTVAGSHLLIATGRVPCTEALGLEHVGVALTEKNYIQVNERLETTAPGIWALGDVTGGPPFTHTSYNDFRIVRANLLEGASRTTADRIVPYCIFTDPELGRVGMSEAEARASGRDILVGSIPMRKVARAKEMSETRGMLKAVVDRETYRLLGAAALGLGGGEIVTELQLAMMGGLTADDIRDAVFIHPVLAEGLHPLFNALQ